MRGKVGQLGCGMWVVWGDHNQVIHGEKVGVAVELEDLVTMEDGATRETGPMETVRWTPLKLITDEAIRAIIRDDLGTVAVAYTKKSSGHFSIDHAKAIAMRDGLHLPRKMTIRLIWWNATSFVLVNP
ncbi:RNase H domain-containing protein [Abeliophyllum distichum]|uniref:RNase H domain-containing protein n=1 Tax=Abeliophyllum distichum TaxID=126358 RepID=A0ABD1Q1H9_9LAMI